MLYQKSHLGCSNPLKHPSAPKKIAPPALDASIKSKWPQEIRPVCGLHIKCISFTKKVRPLLMCFKKQCPRSASALLLLVYAILVRANFTNVTLPPNSIPCRFPSYLFLTLLLYFFFIFYFLRCTLQDFHFCFISGFLAIFILFYSNINTNTDELPTIKIPQDVTK